MASTTNTGYYTPSNSTYTIATGGTGGIGLATTVVYGGGGSVATGQVLGQPLTGPPWTGLQAYNPFMLGGDPIPDQSTNFPHIPKPDFSDEEIAEALEFIGA
jgi:hypothetical protein